MTFYQIEARDPLVFRDGRPNDGRSESRTLAFPLPSTLAGAVRTALGRKGGRFDRSRIPSLLRDVVVRGPALCSETDIYFPAAADSLILADEAGQLSVRPFGPIELPPGAATSGVGAGRSLVGLRAGKAIKAKPMARPPSYWPWAAYEAWLRDPSPRDHVAVGEWLSDALLSLHDEERVHVAIGLKGTAEDGKLFATVGLRLSSEPFDVRDQAQREADEAAHAPRKAHVELRLLIDVEVRDASLGALSMGLRPLGGERRLARWSESQQSWPALPPWLVTHVEGADSSLVRVILLTPAYLESSLGPNALHRAGVAEIIAAKVDRPRVISGWDLANSYPGGWPKATRRLAESGSVFWVRLSGPHAERRRWLDEVWMKNVSDDPQLARDGFGLAVIGIGRPS